VKLFPYHDAAGEFYPELDTRELGVDVMTQYLSLSRITIWKRALRGSACRRGAGASAGPSAPPCSGA
jgi:hypothetical protein